MELLPHHQNPFRHIDVETSSPNSRLRYFHAVVVVVVATAAAVVLLFVLCYPSSWGMVRGSRCLLGGRPGSGCREAGCRHDVPKESLWCRGNDDRRDLLISPKCGIDWGSRPTIINSETRHTLSVLS